MYLNIVDDPLKHPDDKPSIGLLLVKEKNQTIVEYSLAGFRKPIGVAQWQREITHPSLEESNPACPPLRRLKRNL